MSDRQPDPVAATECPKYGGAICKDEAGALCECYPGTASKQEAHSAAQDREVVEFESPLSGYMVAETIRRAYLPAIANRNEGNGDVGRLLDELQDAYDEVVVPVVLSPRLAGMLERRGYKVETHWAPEHGEHVKCYVLRRVIDDAAVTKMQAPEVAA